MKYSINTESLNDICQPSDILSEEGLSQVLIPKSLLNRIMEDVLYRRGGRISFNTVSAAINFKTNVRRVTEELANPNTRATYINLLEAEIEKMQTEEMYMSLTMLTPVAKIYEATLPKPLEKININTKDKPEDIFNED